MDYEIFKIARFNLWDLYLHKNQYPYLGRCYASAIREDADLVTEMKMDEATELFSSVIPRWHKAVFSLFGVSRPNLAILGNEWPHLHAHLVPRFFDTKIFYGIEFKDPNPRGNYSPYPKEEISQDLLFKIRDDIKGALHNIS